MGPCGNTVSTIIVPQLDSAYIYHFVSIYPSTYSGPNQYTLAHHDSLDVFVIHVV